MSSQDRLTSGPSLPVGVPFALPSAAPTDAQKARSGGLSSPPWDGTTRLTGHPISLPAAEPLVPDRPRLVRPTVELVQLLTDRDLLVLKDLEQFRLLSTRHIQRLRFHQHANVASGTRTAVRVLNRLEGHGLISRLSRRVGGSIRGSAANVWQLAATGERVLRRLSGETPRRRYVEPSPQFSRHTLAIAELATRLHEQARTGVIELLELQAEPDCWRQYTNAAGVAKWLKPDLYMVTADTQFESHAFVEVDLATEHLPAVLRKCLAYQRYWRTGIEQTTRDLFPAVVWVTPDETRARKMRTAIQDEPSLAAELFHVIPVNEALSVLAPSTRTPNTSKGGTT